MVNSQWLYGYGVTKINYTDGTSSVHLLTPSGDYRVEEKSVGQFTGLKDKNGVKIYEGDIVTYFREETAVIKFECGCFLINGKLYKDLFYYTDIEKVEVMGNIYENKDLLEE